MRRVLDEPFGKVLLLVLMGDFMQLNPVASHTLMEAFLRESVVSGVSQKTGAEDVDGCKDTALPQLLEIMRKEGGAPIPNDL